jgi:hypothetical protein
MQIFAFRAIHFESPAFFSGKQSFRQFKIPPSSQQGEIPRQDFRRDTNDDEIIQITTSTL